MADYFCRMRAAVQVSRQSGQGPPANVRRASERFGADAALRCGQLFQAHERSACEAFLSPGEKRLPARAVSARCKETEAPKAYCRVPESPDDERARARPPQAIFLS